MDHIEKRILDIIDAHGEELKTLAEDIFTHPEQGYHEYRTSKIVSDFLQRLGLTTQEGLAITGVRAAIGGGEGPNVALVGELDGVACPAHPFASETGISHSCGHHDQIVAILGAALALSDSQVAASLGGTATIFAVPAEEFMGSEVGEEVRASHGIVCAGGKCELLRRGAFDDIDMALTSHALLTGREDAVDLVLGTNGCTGFIGKTVHIHGVAAHAAGEPHLGKNALHAACIGISALNTVRETFQEKDFVRVHACIREGGAAINTTPHHVIIDVVVRANNQSALEETNEKVNQCFRGASHCFDCTTEIFDAQGHLPCPERLPDPVMWEAAENLGDGIKTEAVKAGVCNAITTDVGDLFSVMPVLNIGFGGNTGALHSKDYATTNPDIAHVMPAKMMALLAYRLLKEGGKEAQAIVDNYSAPYTFDDYRAYVKKLNPDT